MKVNINDNYKNIGNNINMTTNKIEYPKYINAISLDDILLNPKYPRLSKSKQGKNEVEVIKFTLSKSATILVRTARDLNKIIKE